MSRKKLVFFFLVDHNRQSRVYRLVWGLSDVPFWRYYDFSSEEDECYLGLNFKFSIFSLTNSLITLCQHFCWVLRCSFINPHHCWDTCCKTGRKYQSNLKLGKQNLKTGLEIFCMILYVCYISIYDISHQEYIGIYWTCTNTIKDSIDAQYTPTRDIKWNKTRVFTI